jgi:putative phosphoesterase
MKIAVFSDVHANLPALEAVLDGIDYQRPDSIYCLGDLVNQNVWNNEVVDLIRKRKIHTVRGNHDNGIGLGLKLFPFSYTFPKAKQWGIEAIDFTLRNITKENREFLLALPPLASIKISQKDQKPFTILMVHGSPFDMNARLFRSMPKEEFRQLLIRSHADILLLGNTHSPYHHVIPFGENDEKIYRHVINPGSVGRPKDGDWRPSYLQLTIHTDRPLLTDPGAVEVDFYRVKYDLGKAVKAIRKSELPLYYGGFLITAG